MELRIACELETVQVTPALILAAAGLHAGDSLSFWNALVIAAAQAADCDELWSEDFPNGRQFGRLKVYNPFANT